MCWFTGCQNALQAREYNKKCKRKKKKKEEKTMYKYHRLPVTTWMAKTNDKTSFQLKPNKSLIR